MSRKGQIRVREVPADPKYHDRTVAKFMNVVMERGKKSLAENIFYGALDVVATRSKEDGLVVFKRALENVRPAVEVRSRRVFTSSKGLAFSTAFLKSFKGSSAVRSLILSIAP